MFYWMVSYKFDLVIKFNVDFEVVCVCKFDYKWELLVRKIVIML